jgi:beta-lactamase class D
MIRVFLSMALVASLSGCGLADDARAGGEPPGGPAPGSVVEQVDLSHHFSGIAGSFVLLDGRTGAYQVHAMADAATRYLPASTFKIPHSLIALETGVVASIDEVRERDPALAPEQDWWPRGWLAPHSIRTGLQASAVWLYQDFAREIGELRMLHWLHRFGYGNASIEGGMDRFWLDGGLRISAFEQVDFLRRFHEGQLPISGAHRDAVRELLVIDEGRSWTLSGKTGWAGFGEAGPGVGWLVGYVAHEGGVHYFATRIDVLPGTDMALRMRLTRAALQELLGVE